MADETHTSKGSGSGWDRWRPGEPLPWARLDWKRWLSDPALRRLTDEQRGKFQDVWASTHGTKTPGVMTEEDVRLWCRYTPAEWKAVREVFAGVFNTTRQRGKWRLEDVIEAARASQERARTTFNRSRKGVEGRQAKRSQDNDMATKGTTTSSTTGTTTSSTPSTTPGCTDVRRKTKDVRLKTGKTLISAVPDVCTADTGFVGLSASSAGDTTAASLALLESALGADGLGDMNGTVAKVGGGS